MTATVTMHLRITGRVQGVGYRDWAVHTARKLGLMGWVRNLTNGSVEALAHGPESGVNAFIAACQAGPPLARVTSVDTAAAPAFSGAGFQHLPTADSSLSP